MKKQVKEWKRQLKHMDKRIQYIKNQIENEPPGKTERKYIFERSLDRFEAIRDELRARIEKAGG